MKKFKGLLPWILIVFAALAADQITKLLAITNLQSIGSVPILGDLLRFTYAENRGMAFSISFFPPWLLSIIAIIASVVLFIFISRDPLDKFRNTCLSLILAGALGNVIDRIRLGYVIDFIDSDFPDFIMHRWPIFNIADSCITVGVILYAIYSFLEKPAEESQTDTATTQSDPHS